MSILMKHATDIATDMKTTTTTTTKNKKKRALGSASSKSAIHRPDTCATMARTKTTTTTTTTSIMHPVQRRTRCHKQACQHRSRASPLRNEKAKLTSAITLVVAISFATATAYSTGGQQLNTAAATTANNRQGNNYFGTPIGPLTSRSNGVAGFVYAVDEQTLFIKDLHYDGQAPDAYFWSTLASSSSGSSPNTPPSVASMVGGFIVPDEKGSTKPLEKYTGADVVLRLPEGKTLREIQVISIWSRQLKRSAGDLVLQPGKLSVPRPLEIGQLSQLAHGVKSGPITIVDAQTLLLADFHYDGLGPAAYFWLTRSSGGLNANGARLKDENGSSAPLRKYTGETVVVSLPDDLTVYDFDFFGVWCVDYQVNFGQVRLPQGASVPPSPKMLGIKPENKLNCEILYDDLGFEIRWVLDGDDIVMQLVGKIDPGEYMAFGLGKDDSKSDMNNADAVVAWVDRTNGQVHAVDYFLGSKQQCANDPKRGSCPDSKLPNGSDSLTLLHGAIVNGYSMVTFKRPQLGVDEQYDQHVYSDGQQSVIWAIGSLNQQQEVGYHRLRTRSNMFIDFARNPRWNCPIPDLNASMHQQPGAIGSPAPANTVGQPQSQASAPLPVTASAAALQPIDATVRSGAPEPIVAPPALQWSQPSSSSPLPTAATPLSSLDASAAEDVWLVPPVVCPQERIFHAQIGPAVARRFTPSQSAGSAGKGGVAWYINGLYSPELVVERGQAYRFIVEGGNDKTSAARRHPLYLTDSLEGGFEFKTDEERQRERVFGGVAVRTTDGQFVPTAEGRLCEWKHTNRTQLDPNQYPSFQAYQRTLRLECSPGGHASALKFIPDSNTPDLIYYQCYTHHSMGWRIRVVDSCASFIQSLNQQLAAGSSRARGTTSTDGLNRASSSLVGVRVNAPYQQQQNRATGNKRNVRHDEQTKRPKLDRRNSGSAESHLLSGGGAGFGEQVPSGTSTSTLATDLLGEFNADELAAANSLAAQLEADSSSEPSIVQQLQGEPSKQQQVASSSPSSLSSTSQPTPSSQQTTTTAASSTLSSSTTATSATPTTQPINLTQLEQMLRGSSELEFIADEPQLSSNQIQFHHQSSQNQQPLFGPIYAPLQPLPLQPPPKSELDTSLFLAQSHQLGLAGQLPNLQAAKLPQLNAAAASNKTSGPTKAPTKSLHAYIRRLASIYYPVQQQLASMLAPTTTTTTPAPPPPQALQAESSSLFQDQIAAAQSAPIGAHAMPVGSEPKASSGGFSLSSLVPKSPLSKSNINKTLSKLRIKSGRKYEPHQSSASATNNAQKPPTPANEFNYDIFNNQLAQLEKQQKQLQELESIWALANQPQTQITSFAPDHLSYLPTLTNPIEEPLYSLDAHSFGPQSQPYAPQYQPPPSPQQVHFSLTPPPQMFLRQQQSRPTQQQVNLNETYDAHRPASQQQQQARPSPAQNYYPQPQPQQQQQQQQSQRPPGNQPTDQGAVYVARVPQFVERPTNAMRIVEQPSVRYPNIQPYNSNSSPDNNYEQNQQYPQQRPADGDALSLSGSGANYAFKRQPSSTSESQTQTAAASNSNSDLLDHMLAIERFSKQSSERRPPSVVHPITGEQVDGSRLDQPAQQAKVQPLVHRHHIPSQQQPRFSKLIGASDGSDVLSAEQSAQSADLRRLNANETSVVVNRTTQVSSPVSSSSTNELRRLATNCGSPDYSAGKLCANNRARDTSTQTTSGSLQQATLSNSFPTHVLVKPEIGFFAASPVTTLAPPPEMPTTTMASGNASVVYKSTLLEPISSTLVPEPTPPPARNLHAFVRFDPNPFVPIETRQSEPQLIPLLGSGSSSSFSSSSPMRPMQRPAFIESMFSQYQSPVRPEPPVQVASYLAQHIAHQRNITPTQMQSASTPLRSSGGDLIVLKPTVLADESHATFALKPQYLSAQVSSSLSAGSESSRSIESPASENELSGGNLDQLSESNRFVGHRFDRLRSLASPPTTSIVTSSAAAAAAADELRNINKSQDLEGAQSESQLQNHRQQQLELRSSIAAGTTNGAKFSAADPATSAPSLATREDSPSNAAKSMAPQVSESSSFIHSDNSTDNAILSHVMSLISSNAIPTPPLVPVASYSNAAMDTQFLPISDPVRRSMLYR